MKKRPDLHSLRSKLTLLIICIILVLTLGLMGFSYSLFRRNVMDNYTDRLTRAVNSGAAALDVMMMQYYREAFSSEEFQSVRKQALEAGSEAGIQDWMDRTPSYSDLSLAGYFDEKVSSREDIPEVIDLILDMYMDNVIGMYTEYIGCIGEMRKIAENMAVDGIYLLYEENGTAYALPDSRKTDLFYLGAETSLPEAYQDDPDSSAASLHIQHSEDRWLCTAGKLLIPTEEGTSPFVVCADIDMTKMVNEYQSFLINSLLFVILLTAGILFLSLTLTDRMVIRPLRQLASATKSFVQEDREYSREDIVRLNIRSRDEIGTLNREFHAMRERIIDYTENLSRVTAERARVTAELETAAKIQEAALPAAFPDREELQLSALMSPAKEVGGDFYDYFFIDASHLALVIADVSDKGVPAALFMMASKNTLADRISAGESPAEILAGVNRKICASNPGRMFFTVWLGILDLDTGVLRCSNAGHEYPLIRREGGNYALYRDSHSMPVGSLARTKFRDYEILLNHGDTMLVYTDGIPDAADRDGAFYGMDRLLQALNRQPELPPDELIHSLREDIARFTDGAPQFDDITMLCFRYRGSHTGRGRDAQASDFE